MESVDGQRLYYIPDRTEHQLWQLPLGGDTASPSIVPGITGIAHGWWSPAAEGIYFADTTSAGAETPAAATGYPIYLYRFATRRLEPLAHIAKPIVGANPDFAVSPDGKRIVWAQVDLVSSNIMIVDGFR